MKGRTTLLVTRLIAVSRSKIRLAHFEQQTNLSKRIE